MRKDVPGALKLEALLTLRRKKLNYLMVHNYHLYKSIITEYNIQDIMPFNAHHK